MNRIDFQGKQIPPPAVGGQAAPQPLSFQDRLKPVALGGWDVVSSIRLEHLNHALSDLVRGQSFDATEDKSKIGGVFDGWALSAPKGVTQLTVTISKGEVIVDTIGSFSLQGATVTFPIDFAHMAATPANPNDELRLKFTAVGLGPGDSTDVHSVLSCPEIKRLDAGTRDVVQTVTGWLTVNAILANPTMAALPIAVLMRKGSIHAAWYTPKHVQFALSTREDGASYASILVCIKDRDTSTLSAQPPAELHAGAMNMAFSRNVFFENVIAPSVKAKLGTQPAGFFAFDDATKLPNLLGMALPQIPAGAHVLAYTNFIPDAAMNQLKGVYLKITSAQSSWEGDQIKTDMVGEVSATSVRSLAWYEFSGHSVMQIVFDPSSQRVELKLTDHAPSVLAKKGMAVLDFVSGDQKLDTGQLAAAVCGMRDFAPPSQYTFEWAGVRNLTFDGANFSGDVLFSCAQAGV